MLSAKLRMMIAAVMLAAGLFFTVFGARSFLRGRSLLDRGAIAEAAVTDVGHRTSDSDTGHQVHYRFRVGDRDYQRVGLFGTAVGSDVSAEAQAASLASGHLMVRYLPEDPSINEPVAHARPQKDRGIIAFGIGLFVVVVGTLRMWRARQDRRLELARVPGEDPRA